LTMPAVSAAGMAAVDPDQAGIAPGVINPSRQVGAAVGIAVLGAGAVALARGDWQGQLSTLAPATQAKASQLTALVLGGQGAQIAALAGRPAEHAGLESFVYGLRGALIVSAGLALIGS